jgi:hypothetical protein
MKKPQAKRLLAAWGRLADPVEPAVVVSAEVV